MRVLYVSKASCVAGHRDKLAALAQHVELTLVAPERWGGTPFEKGVPQGARAQSAAASEAERYRTVLLPTFLHGHNHFHFYRGLERVLVPGAFDLVHVDEEPYSLVTFQVMAHARRSGAPALFFAWQNIDKRLPPPFGALRAGVFRRVAGGIAGNHEAAQVLRRRGFAGPLAVIPQMGVDPDRFRPDAHGRQELRARLDLAEGDFLVGYLGRLVPEKGVDLLLDALVDVPGARGLVMGDGPERPSLEGRAAARGLVGRLRFAGPVASLEAPRWLAALDCLVLPSRTTAHWKEQFGRVLIEAMACGVPVVGSSSGAIPTVIGDAGRVFPEGDFAALGRELTALSLDGALRSELGGRGRAWVLASYSQGRIVAETVAFYRKLLGLRAAVAPAVSAAPPVAARGS